MSTVVTKVAAGDWTLTVRPGDRITAIDGYDIGTAVVAEVEPGGVLRMTTPANQVPRRLYPGSHQDATVERDVPDPEPDLPGTHWGTRARNAVRRNPRYVRLLAELSELDDPYFATNRGIGVTLASMSMVYGYGWTERDGRGWRITALGRKVLASALAEGITGRW